MATRAKGAVQVTASGPASGRAKGAVQIAGSSAVTAAITGTATSTITEADIVAGGKTIIITLTGDTWLAAGTGPIGTTANTQAIIDGLDSAQSETLGWNLEVRDKEVTTAVVRTSATVCTITLTAQSAYNVTAQEVITATVPAEALTLAGVVVATPTITVDAISAAITGTATASIQEADIVAGGKTVIITLTNDTWVAAGTGPIGSTADTQAIIDGMNSAQSETLGWNNEVRDKEVTTAVVRTSPTVCTITLTAQAAYEVTAQEVITVTVPAAAIASTRALISTPTFTVDDTLPQYVQKWTDGTTGTSNTTFTLDIDTIGATAGNLLVAMVGIGFGGDVFTTPTGWTLLETASVDSPNNVGFASYWRVATGTTADNFTPVWTDAGACSLMAAEYSGLDATSSFEDSAEDAGSIATAVTTMATGSATPVTSDGLAIALLFADAPVLWDTTTTIDNSFIDTQFYGASTASYLGIASKVYTTTAAQSATWTTTDTGGVAYGTMAVFAVAAAGTVNVVLSGQTVTSSQGILTVRGDADIPLGGQTVTSSQGIITVSTPAGGWSVTDVDGDESIVDAQTGVVISITGTVAVAGKTVWIEQGGNWVEQSVTAQDASSATITVTYGGSLVAGAATLYVRNPL